MDTDAERIHELMMDLVRASGLLEADHAISISQAFALHELDTDAPLSQRDLAERLRLEKSSVSRMVAEMERKGFVVRERDPENRRQYRLRLTEQGRHTHMLMGAAAHAKYAGWVSAMTPVERAALVKGLTALVRAVREHFV